MPIKRSLGLVVVALAVLGLISLPSLPKLNNRSHVEPHEPTITSVPTLPRILCYGDSLTLGLSPPNHIDADTYCPYSIPLKDALENSIGHLPMQPQPSLLAVDHIGLSGWTSTQFLKHSRHPEMGLESAVSVSAKATCTIVILLVGTNDIGRVLRNVQDDVPKAANYISRNLWTLHELALQAGARHTLAVAIPNSRYHQATTASLVVAEVNRKLDERTTSRNDNHNRTTFVRFPVDTADEANWSSDGLHLSCKGYDTLGKALALTVETIWMGNGVCREFQ